MTTRSPTSAPTTRPDLRASVRDHTALGFGSVVVRAGGGENDIAHFTDLPGPVEGTDDVFYLKSHKTVLVNPNVKVTVRAFDEIHATASESGFDVARIYDTVGDDHLEVEGGHGQALPAHRRRPRPALRGRGV